MAILKHSQKRRGFTLCLREVDRHIQQLIFYQIRKPHSNKPVVEANSVMEEAMQELQHYHVLVCANNTI